MSMDNLERYYDALELEMGASPADVRSAYIQLKALYSSDAVVTSPIMDELDGLKKEDILQQIEEAYKGLNEAVKPAETRPPEERVKNPTLFDDDIRKEIADIPYYDGKALKGVREKLGIELYDIALVTRIRQQYLEDIEDEKFDALPAQVYIKGYVENYARALSIEPGKAVADYMLRYSEWKISLGK